MWSVPNAKAPLCSRKDGSPGCVACAKAMHRLVALPQSFYLLRLPIVTEVRSMTARPQAHIGIPKNLHQPEDCRAVSEVLQRVGDKWTVLVVSTLGGGPKRFNELRKALGSISQRMLTLTLRGLERDGLVTRTVFPSIPPRVEYELTRLGRSLLEPVSELGAWARKNRAAIVDARQRFDRVTSSRPAELVPRHSGSPAPGKPERKA
jgi:DNA-binding HxlR family transcriptional regulator